MDEILIFGMLTLIVVLGVIAKSMRLPYPIAFLLGGIVLAFVPSPDEANPTLEVLKVAGITAVLLVGGAAVYIFGNARTRRAAATVP